MREDPAKAAGRPLLLFDGACGFCRRAVLRLERSCGERLGYVAYQDFDFDGAPPGLTAEACDAALHLLEADGRVSRGAEACARALSYAPARGFVAALYELPLVAGIAERVYGFVAGHRRAISKLVRLLSGPDPEPSTYGIGRRLFAVMLGIGFLCSFLSFGSQAAGLIGSQGILPLESMVAWQSHAMPQGFLSMPTLFWFGADDAALAAVLWAGGLAAVGLTAGLWPRAMLAVTWLCWLSLTSLAFPPAHEYVGNVFLGYQWDALLVEAGLLAFFILPGGLLGRYRQPVGAAGVLLLRFLLLRVVFGSAAVRHAAGDSGWDVPGALGRHLWTQPLPTWPGVLVHELGEGLQRALWVAEDVFGLIVIFGLFGPRRIRAIAAVGTLALACGGFCVGRQGVWPWMVVALASLAIDDQSWRRLLPARVAARVRSPERRLVPAFVQTLRAGFGLLLAGIATWVTIAWLTAAEPTPFRRLLLSWQVCNGYGPSPSVAPRRFAVSIEGSDDGQTWSAIAPRFSPLEPYAAPPWPGLHLPRVDWKLDDVAQRYQPGVPPDTWFALMLTRLLEGSAAVRALFADGPFDQAPPRALRVLVHELSPADADERAQHGMWWYRAPGAVLGVPMMLDERGRLTPASF